MTEPLLLPALEGSITITPTALTRLVVLAAESVCCARARRCRRVEEIGR